MAEKTYDLVVIGGGPAGYVGAIRAAQLGLSVAVIERAKLGGVCLNWGCIPSKALLSNAELYHRVAHEAEEFGMSFDNLKVDWSKVIGRSRDVASKLNNGVGFLLKKNKVDHIVGHAKILKGATGGTPCEIALHDVEVKETITHAPAEVGKQREVVKAKNIMVATGSVARDLPFAKFDGDKIIGAREAMTLPEQPKKLIVVGSGAIGIEFGYFYNAYGTEVTVVEMLDRIVPVEDTEASKALQKSLKKQGMNFKTGFTTTGVQKTADGVKVTIAPFKDGKADESKAEVLEADKVLLAIGVRGRYDGLFDESLGIQTVKDHIKTDYVPIAPGGDPAPNFTYATDVPGIYAVGDVIGPPWLAHVSSEEAIICVERIAGHDPIPMDYTVIPGCTYCHPQVASVGFTEDALKARGLKKGTDYEVGTFANTALGKAIATKNTDGFVKIIKGLPRGEVLGAHIVGEAATEMISELTLARRLEATTEELNVTVHAHPTMHEGVHEASLAADGKVIHM